jgi:short-subunit dehydrogenase
MKTTSPDAAVSAYTIGRGTRAIVTGASWGIGETFARVLAARGADVLLVARNEERLQTLAAELRTQHGVRVEPVALDLGAPDGPRDLCETAAALGFVPTLLVNNAGVGVLGPFADLPLERAREMIHLNVLSVTDVTYRVLSGMQARGSGMIINVGSASALQPLPHYGVYAATKAFVVSLTAALWAENQDRGVHVVAVCPGAVDVGVPTSASTGFGPGVPVAPRWRFPRKVSREAVVAAALSAAERNVPIVLPGAPAWVARTALGMLPRQARLRLTGMLLSRYPAMLTGIRRRAP